MNYQPLGRTGLMVSRICLGTMTFGEQNPTDAAHRLLDRAVAAGVNFLDTAEMYPIPPSAASAGATEAIIGATTLDQLAANLAAETLVLSPAVRDEIEAVHADNPNPAP